MRAFNFEPFLSHIQRHRITHIQTAPPVLVMLAKRPETKKYDLSSLVNILCGAAPLSKELQNEVSTKFNLKVVQTWGMTEVTCSCLHVPGGMDDRSGSVGQVDPNSTIKLIDESGNEVTKPGQRGEIFVRGPNVCEQKQRFILSRMVLLISAKDYSSRLLEKRKCHKSLLRQRRLPKDRRRSHLRRQGLVLDRRPCKGDL
jgi:acyl-coenzyme A synthetase/AMP-(fatty) acid ligase